MVPAAPSGDDAAPLLLYFHGGGYFQGSPRTHRALAAALAGRAGMAARVPDYRLAPEHPFPAAPEDARALYLGLLAAGLRPGRIVLAGDSAGGGLALALLHVIGAEGLPWPAATVVFSPWTDLTVSGESVRTNAGADPLLPASRLADVGAAYLAGADARDPRASPLFGQFAGAPPTLIQASRHEILRDDSVRMAGVLRDQGVDVTLELSDRLPHVWQIFQGRLPEADAALDRAGAFLRAHLHS
ncbi:MAG: alpha/beta hydrolase fold domain-containing protein, partial [Pseudomonadota bacterium]